MKYFVPALLATVLSLASATAQAPENAPAPAPAPGNATPAAGKDAAVTRINGPGPAKAGAPTGAAAAAPKAGAAYIPEGQSNSTGYYLWDLVRQGGWAMYALVGLSFLTVMLVLVFFATLRRSAILTSHYMNTADVLLKKRDYLGLLAISSRHNEAVARVAQRTLDFATKNPNSTFEVVKDVAESEGSAQTAAFQHRVTYLADIGTVAPMVGLLGTVIGIIEAFGELGGTVVAEKRDVLIAAGVAKALMATSAGLIVGIVAFGFYSYFRNKVQRLISDLEVASAHIMGLMALNYKKREPSRAALEEEF